MREANKIAAGTMGAVGMLGAAAVSMAMSAAAARREANDVENLAGWVEYWQTRALQAERRLVAERAQAAGSPTLRRAQARVRDLEDRVELLVDENDDLRDRLARLHPQAV
ncbi:hypothetical protein JYK14_24530 [Siccirubricoccus sp. KC 17139]|uniref:Uncharacterized protein n=1 Tax=Siccirubricoccus soli TaxID=2899147 RepID=A0ABT1DBI5_9PROT|nr:hypothetical protein [Siccirubricoccus soli]MCO6419302.1 hypothetical protein [Siccirubricoccus soli]MCP2685437.1 hypothetical protein [Siccirubricoccus soli]